VCSSDLFTKYAPDLLASEDFRELQSFLIIRPDAGPVIVGSGGLRKLRWAGSGRGKRGGTCVIYYWVTAQERLYLLYIYSKNVQDDLTEKQLKTLRDTVERECQ
jgi:mRNA-degrading endonuclease RelE of RelBE toxin-antitoxin system